MQIFNKRANNLVHIFNESVRKELASLIKSEEEQIKPDPTVMEPNQIKQKLQDLKANKNKFKSFILNFENLSIFACFFSIFSSTFFRERGGEFFSATEFF